MSLSDQAIRARSTFDESWAPPPRPAQITPAEIDRRFSHHTPAAEQTNTHGAIREAYKAFASTIADWLPEGREKALAFTALEESSFWAHAAVAREGK